MHDRLAINGIRQQGPALIARRVDIETGKPLKYSSQLRLIEVLDGKMCTFPVEIIPMIPVVELRHERGMPAPARKRKDSAEHGTTSAERRGYAPPALLSLASGISE